MGQDEVTTELFLTNGELDGLEAPTAESIGAAHVAGNSLSGGAFTF